MGKKVKNTSTGKIKQGAEQSAKQKEPGSSKERKKQVTAMSSPVSVGTRRCFSAHT